METATKPKVFTSESARSAALTRWATQRVNAVVRLEGLTPEEKAIVLAYAELGRKRLERAVKPEDKV